MTDIDCPKLERIEEEAFDRCKSLSNINLPSAKIVDSWAFAGCEALMVAKFGKNLEIIRDVFYDCSSLERITIPLKNNLITADDTFEGCEKLKCVDLVERAILQETINALLMDEWRKDMIAEISSINQILSNASAGYYDEEYDHDYAGEKAVVMGEWITRVLRKIVGYKAQHYSLLNEAAAALQLVLPKDIVMSIVLPFLNLPEHTFDGEDDEEE